MHVSKHVVSFFRKMSVLRSRRCFFFSSGGIQWAKCGVDKKLIMVPASISAKESWISIPCRVQRQCCLSLMLHLLLGAYVVLVCWLRSCSIPEPHIGFRTVIRTGHFNMSASALAGRDGGWMPLRRSSCGSHTIIQSSYRFHSWLQSGTPMQKTLLPNVTSQTSAKTKKNNQTYVSATILRLAIVHEPISCLVLKCSAIVAETIAV